MLRNDESAALASNWRVVLAVDAGLGVLMSSAGVVVVLAVNPALGVTMVVFGAAYVALVGARARRWLRLRRGAGASR